MLDVDVRGANMVVARLNRSSIRIRNAAPILRRVGQRLLVEFAKNMRKGVNPDGVKLPKPEPWTRYAGATRGRNLSGNFIPLHNTGTLARSMMIVRLDRSQVRIGWNGGMAKVAETQYYGLPSTMKLKQRAVKGWYSGIKTAKDGGTYARIKKSKGWVTVNPSGDMIDIQPRARRFFYISPRQVALVDRAMRTEIRTATQ